MIKPSSVLLSSTGVSDFGGSEVNNKPMTERLLNPGPKIYFCN